MCCSSKTRNQSPRHHRRGYMYIATDVPSGPTPITDQTPLIADHASTVSGSPPSYHAAMKSEVPPYPAHGGNEKEHKQDRKDKKSKDKKDKQDKTEVTFPTALAAIPEGSVEFNDGFAVVTAPNGEVYRLEMSTLSQQEIDCLEHGHQRKRKFGCLGIIWGIVFFPGGLLGTYCDSYVQCTHCKTILSEKHCITHRLLHRNSKDGAVKTTTAKSGV